MGEIWEREIKGWGRKEAYAEKERERDKKMRKKSGREGEREREGVEGEGRERILNVKSNENSYNCETLQIITERGYYLYN